MKANKINVGGVWKRRRRWRNIGGEWKIVTSYYNAGGDWKRTTPIPYWYPTSSNSQIINFGESFNGTSGFEVELKWKKMSDSVYGPSVAHRLFDSTSWYWSCGVDLYANQKLYIEIGKTDGSSFFTLATDETFNTADTEYKAKFTYDATTKEANIYVWEDGSWVLKATGTTTFTIQETVGATTRLRPTGSSIAKIYKIRIKGLVGAVTKDCLYDMYFDVGNTTIRERTGNGPVGTLEVTTAGQTIDPIAEE